LLKTIKTGTGVSNRRVSLTDRPGESGGEPKNSNHPGHVKGGGEANGVDERA